MTFIILEGVDGAGKSTLAEAVIEQLEYQRPGEPVEYMHRAQLKRDPLDEYALDVQDYRPGAGKHIVADRWHFGEPVYGPLYRDDSALSPGTFRWVELFLKARGATTWHVTASLETIQNRLRVRGEDYLEDRDVEYVWKEFAKIAKRSLLFGGNAITDVNETDELAAQIVSEAIWVEDRATPVFTPSYIGRHLPSVLLAVKNDPATTPAQAPFQAKIGEGEFFLEALPELWWRSVGIVDAGAVDVASLAESLFDPEIIAVGDEASEALDDQYVEDYSIVPAPDRIMRWHARDKSAYGAMIKTTSIDGGNKLTWPK